MNKILIFVFVVAFLGGGVVVNRYNLVQDREKISINQSKIIKLQEQLIYNKDNILALNNLMHKEDKTPEDYVRINQLLEELSDSSRL